MSEILGYDCNGKALRAGDQVSAVFMLPIWRATFGNGPFAVVGASYEEPGHIEIDVRMKHSFPPEVHTRPDNLRRIDDQERGDWSEIEKATGWNPEAVPA